MSPMEPFGKIGVNRVLWICFGWVPEGGGVYSSILSKMSELACIPLPFLAFRCFCNRDGFVVGGFPKKNWDLYTSLFFYKLRKFHGHVSPASPPFESYIR